MDDIDGPAIAEVFYSHLFKPCQLFLSPDHIPYALDDAVQQLRLTDTHPSRWATFIHLGM